MKKANLQFDSLQDLVDFLLITEAIVYDCDKGNSTLTVEFREADLELAKAAYNAVLLEFA